MNAEKILELITESESDGLKDTEIASDLTMKIFEVRNVLRRLYKAKLVFRSLSENKWKLVKYRTQTEEGFTGKGGWTGE